MAYLKPGFVLARLLNPLILRLGLATALTVRGRRTGRPHTVPVNVLELSGARYLVAPRGETLWVRNLRAAGEAQLRRRGRSERVRATELPVEERQPIIDAYLERWGSQVRSQFEQLPGPGDHPVFRIEAA